MGSLSSAGCWGGSKAPETRTAAAPQAGDTTSSAAAAAPAVRLDPRLHQSFVDATVAEPPAEWHRPPDLTMTNKSIGKLYTDVVNLWDTIRFVAPSGKRLNYRAVVETEMGTFEIGLLPELAPNHVRSFVALARTGYYDGLVFDRTVHEDVDGRPESRREMLEAGCPLGTGEAGYGSIGYWLKPEFSHATHEEGTVGASHGEQEDTAACKFYINLCKSPFMDGNFTVFGKVTRGLDVARKIFSMPVRNDPEFPDGDRPAKPVVIRKITIETDEAERAAGP
jgi:cyclophilin family peptidyl-prolyl cis-trans isomerase